MTDSMDWSTPVTVGRQLFFSPADEAAYARLLREHMPGLTFHGSCDRRNGLNTPPLLPQGREFSDIRGGDVEIVLQDDWRPSWEKVLSGGPGEWRWSYGHVPWPNGQFDRSFFVVSEEHEHFRGKAPAYFYMYGGRCYFRCLKGDKAQLSLARKAINLISKIATSHYSLYHWPSMTLQKRMTKAGWGWYGHELIRWVNEAPRERAMSFYNGDTVVMPYDYTP